MAYFVFNLPRPPIQTLESGLVPQASFFKRKRDAEQKDGLNPPKRPAKNPISMDKNVDNINEDNSLNRP